MVSKPESRADFIKSSISYLRAHNFDGLNLDWQYPGQNGSPSTDRMKFTDLVQVTFSFPLQQVFNSSVCVNQMGSFLHMLKDTIKVANIFFFYVAPSRSWARPLKMRQETPGRPSYCCQLLLQASSQSSTPATMFLRSPGTTNQIKRNCNSY